MTQPQKDPAEDFPVSIARLSEQLAGLRREVLAQDRLYGALISANADKVELALTASDKALAKAETATEKRFDAVNEFRSQLADQAATFMPRTEADASTQRLTERIQELTDRVNTSGGATQGAKENKTGLYAALGAAGLLITILLSAVVIVVNILTR